MVNHQNRMKHMLWPLMHPQDKLWLLVDSARPICSNKLPKNLYGEAPFIVKVQVCAAIHVFKASMGLGYV